MSGGVYVIQNQVNGKRYVGSAVKFGKRWNVHKSDLRNQRHDSSHLQRAWNKYGEGAFSFIEHELVEPTKDLLLEREQFWMDFYKSYDPEFGYNICRVAGNCLGVKRSEESKKRMSKIQQSRAKLSWEEVLQLREKYLSGQFTQKDLAKEYGITSSTVDSIIKNKTWKDETLGDEYFKRASEVAIKNHYCPSEEQRKQMASAQLGSKHSEETRRKMSASLLGRKHSDETRRKISFSHCGEKCYIAKLTWLRVSEIREKYLSGNYTYAALAKEYGIVLSGVQKVVNNEIWKDELLGEEYFERVLKVKNLRYSSEEAKEKNRRCRLGRKHSEEAKKKISKALGGENNRLAKLSWRKVKEIREKYLSGNYTYAALAGEYGVALGTIGAVLLDKTWKEENRNVG
jgi:uncharacterized protein YjcR